MTIELAEAVTVLERTPAVLRALLHDLPAAWTSVDEGPVTWSPFDRFAQFAESAGRSLAELLDEFGALRAQSLRDLAALRLTSADLALNGTHPAFGRVSLGQLLATWTAHDLGHLAQVCRVMAGRYREDVGPWRAYLPIVAPRR